MSDDDTSATMFFKKRVFRIRFQEFEIIMYDMSTLYAANDDGKYEQNQYGKEGSGRPYDLAWTSRWIVRTETRPQRPGSHPDDGTGHVKMVGRIVVHQPHHSGRAQTQAWHRAPRQVLPPRRPPKMDRVWWENRSSHRGTNDERRNQETRPWSPTPVIVRIVDACPRRSRSRVEFEFERDIWPSFESSERLGERGRPPRNLHTCGCERPWPSDSPSRSQRHRPPGDDGVISNFPTSPRHRSSRDHPSRSSHRNRPIHDARERGPLRVLSWRWMGSVRTRILPLILDVSFKKTRMSTMQICRARYSMYLPGAAGGP